MPFVNFLVKKEAKMQQVNKMGRSQFHLLLDDMCNKSSLHFWMM